MESHRPFLGSYFLHWYRYFRSHKTFIINTYLHPDVHNVINKES